MNNLSLLDDAYMDVLESAIAEAGIDNFIDGIFSGGSKPNQEVKPKKARRNTE